MFKQVTVTVPEFIYNIYTDAAKNLLEEGYTIESVMSAALHAYAQHLFEEMLADGTLSASPSD